MKHEVQCAFGLWLPKWKPRWWPLLPVQIHEDPSLGAPQVHFHIDDRFLTPRAYAAAAKWASIYKERYDPTPAAMSIWPLMCFVDPVTGEQPEPVNPDLDNTSRLNEVRREWVLATCMKTRRLKRFRDTLPAYPMERRELQAEFEYQAAAPICPHRGMDLTAVEPGPDGVTVCPAHGLRICAGVVMPPSDKTDRPGSIR